MKFRTKMIVVFLTVILAPVLMLVLTFWGSIASRSNHCVSPTGLRIRRG